MVVLDGKTLEQAERDYQSTRTDPFSHVVLENFLTEDIANQCQYECSHLPMENFVAYSDPDFEYEKFTINKTQFLPKTVKRVLDYLQSPEMIRNLTAITGMTNLRADPQSFGG